MPQISSCKAVIRCRNVSLDIPVFSTETRSLKSALIRSVTGGQIHRLRSGAVVSALKSINCDIYEGDRVALIGHNGAGKSTFLKVVSGVYTGYSGNLEKLIHVHPMIQKSIITSPELSGLQAIKAHYLTINGNLEGFDSFFNDVVIFSGLGDFIHLPVKTYSEGMSARLVFSMLTSSTHDCLAIDEGFGAGDSSFYNKAQARMADFLNTTGTLLLASHSESLLRQFCTRAIVFEQGSIAFDGDLESALRFYHSSSI